MRLVSDVIGTMPQVMESPKHRIVFILTPVARAARVQLTACVFAIKV